MSLTSTVIGISIIAFVVLFAIFSTKESIQAKKEKKDLEDKLVKAEEDKQTLVDHNQKSNEIKEQKGQTEKEIEDAKTKEELVNLANSIANRNNDKLHKQTEGRERSGSSTKTSKTRITKS